MARRGDHSLEEIKAMVLAAAKTIVEEQGYAKLTVRKIAMDMGYTVGSVYMVFENMADLLWHLKAEMLDEILSVLQQAPRDDIEAQAITYLNFAGQNFNRWILVFEHHSEEQGERPAWYHEKLEAIYAHLETELLRVNPKSGNADIAARVLWSGVHGVCVCGLGPSASHKAVLELQSAVGLLVRNFLYGWRHSPV